MDNQSTIIIGVIATSDDSTDYQLLVEKVKTLGLEHKIEVIPVSGNLPAENGLQLDAIFIDEAKNLQPNNLKKQIAVIANSEEQFKKKAIDKNCEYIHISRKENTYGKIFDEIIYADDYMQIPDHTNLFNLCKCCIRKKH